jgi:hypothetical protein
MKEKKWKIYRIKKPKILLAQEFLSIIKNKNDTHKTNIYYYLNLGPDIHRANVFLVPKVNLFTL